MRYTVVGLEREIVCESVVLPSVGSIIDIGDMKHYVVKSVIFSYRKDTAPRLRNGAMHVDFLQQEILIEVG